MKIILSSVSARPNFVKLAAVHHALAARPEDFRHIIVHTGQHYDPLLSDIFVKQLDIPEPNENLGMKGGEDHEEVIRQTAEAYGPVLAKYKPDIVLVYGDVNGGVGALRATAKAGMTIGHVEAGLRSGDLRMPEERNRIEIDRTAQLLFATEQSALDHLKDEGVAGTVHFVGNTMIDTLIRMLPIIERESLPVDIREPFAVTTLHRPSNVDSREALMGNFAFLAQVAKWCPVVMPLHHRMRMMIEKFGLKSAIPARVTTTDPLGYIPFLRLVKNSQFLLTDSGGIQEEATFLKKRCFTLRLNTERPSTIESGSNILIDLEKKTDRKMVLDYAEHPIPPKVVIPPQWDGKTGRRIADVLAVL